MTENAKIEWAHHAFNPWVGRTPRAERRRTSERNWRQPIKWNAEADRLGIRYRVFCSSLADVFDNTVPQEWRNDLFTLIEQTPHLDWLLLTKRIGNVGNMLPVPFDFDRLYPNVWLGATISNQEEADRNIPKLLALPAARYFLSIEPLLGGIDLTDIVERVDQSCENHFSSLYDPDDVHAETNTYIEWVIVGGESGPCARPMHPNWVRSLRDQCAVAHVPFFFKQHGEWLATDFLDNDMEMIPGKHTAYVRMDGSFHNGEQGVDFFGEDEETVRVGKKAAGRLLDGRTWDEVPA
jgi:protein gp37